MKKLFIMLILSAVTAGAFSQGHWQLLKGKNQPGSRGECSLAAAGGKLYLIGGDGGARPVEAYDPATNTWAKKAGAPFTMHHFQSVGLGDKVYVLDAFYEGGYPDQVPLPNVYSYDTKKDSWQKLAEIPADRRRAGAGEAVYNGKIYIVCGITHGHRSGTNGMFDCYDPVTDKWTTLPDAPHIRDHSMAVVVGDKLYAVGGRNTSLHDANNFMSFFDKVVLDVDCYDFKTGKWSTLAAKLPMGTGGGTAVNLDGKIFYIGGERATATRPNGPQKDVYCLDPRTDKQWTKVADLNRARNGVGGAVLNHKIYIAGGASGPGGPPPKPLAQGANPPPPPAAAKTGNNPPPKGSPPGPPSEQGDIALEVYYPGH
ncbi:MAG: Kelch repeat-containing protein [Mucilaginibacter sp.]